MGFRVTSLRSVSRTQIRKKNSQADNITEKINKTIIFSRKNISWSLLGVHKKQFLTVFDLCSVFEVQMQLSLVFAPEKASEKNLEILCSLVIYAWNFKHDFLSEKSAYNTRRNTVVALFSSFFFF